MTNGTCPKIFRRHVAGGASLVWRVSMSVRAKFKVVDKHDGENGSQIRMEAVTSGSAENDSFFKWTPSGQLSMGTINAEAAKQFEVGKEYYLDFTPASA